MIHDRGRIKWVSLMIPQHKKLIANLYHSESDVTLPTIDEQKMEEMNEVISLALQEERDVVLKYFSNRRHFEVTGTIERVDPLTKQIRIVVGSEIKIITFANLIDVYFA
ncbi:YolD-like family protein [Paenibacillus gansuensis]|uniref:YolD-like family protein n=1 Tax=Paenibacillus gansuensis TaxID=306542 RepID=A0ABW5PKK7_9BACL